MPEAATLLFDAEAIRHRVEQIGRDITEDYAGSVPVLVAVLKGSAVFLADLLRSIGIPVEVDFMSISSYANPGADGSGRVRILKDLDQDIGGRRVILVEDIVDTGLTASYLISTLESRAPESIRLCALLDKSVRRIAPLEVRYVGFDCPDQFVVGYGLDYQQRFRNLAAIWAVEDFEALDERLLAADREALRLPR